MLIFSYPTSMESTVNELIDRGIERDVIQKYIDYARKKMEVKRLGRTNGSHRDSQKTKTYKAEWSFERKNYTKIKTFGKIEEAQKRADQITKSKTWKNLVDTNRRSWNGVEVEFMRGTSLCGQASMNKVMLTKAGMDEYTLKWFGYVNY